MDGAEIAKAKGQERCQQPKFFFQNGAYIRVSQNGDGSWDMRGCCPVCGGTRTGTCKINPRRPQQGRPLGKVVAFVLALSELAPDHDKATHYSVDLTYKRRLHAREKMEPAMDADRKMWWPKQPENWPLERGVELGIDVDGEPLVCSR